MSTMLTSKYRITAVAILCVASAAVMMAQVTTTTTEKKGAPTSQSSVERGEVVYVAGNELVVKMENGEVRHFTVPTGATATVDGKAVGLKDLKSGMKLERTITTTSTPKTVSTVRTGTGTIVIINPPSFVSVRFEDGSVEGFKIPAGTTFNVDGQDKTAFDLRAGMKISATRVTDKPAVDVTETKAVTGTAARPVPTATPPQQGALLISAPMPAGAGAAPKADSAPAAKSGGAAPAAGSAPAGGAAKLPKTGSAVPLMGLLGVLFSGASFGVRMLRRSSGR